MPCLQFHTHSPPDIGHGTSQVVSILNVPMGEAGKSHMAYHVHDFFAFKILLNDEANRCQSWLSMVDPIRAVTRYSLKPYQKHGAFAGKNPLVWHGKTKYDTVRDDSSTLEIEPSPRIMMAKLMREITSKGLQASEKPGRSGRLTIMAFGPTTAEQDIILDIQEKVILTVEMMLACLEPNHTWLEVTLFTPALFSAGWTVNPFLGARPSGWKGGKVAERKLIARNLGACFAEEVVEGLMGANSPLWSEAGRKMLGGDETLLPSCERARRGEDLEGERFKWAILEAIRTRFAREPSRHFLNIEEEKDEWMAMGLKRMGFGLCYMGIKFGLIPPEEDEDGGDSDDDSQDGGAEGKALDRLSLDKDPGEPYHGILNPFCDPWVTPLTSWGGTPVTQQAHLRRLMQISDMLSTEETRNSPEGDRDPTALTRVGQQAAFAGHKLVASPSNDRYDLVPVHEARELLSIVEDRFSALGCATYVVDMVAALEAERIREEKAAGDASGEGWIAIARPCDERCMLWSAERHQRRMKYSHTRAADVDIGREMVHARNLLDESFGGPFVDRSVHRPESQPESNSDGEYEEEAEYEEDEGKYGYWSGIDCEQTAWRAPTYLSMAVAQKFERSKGDGFDKDDPRRYEEMRRYVSEMIGGVMEGMVKLQVVQCMTVKHVKVEGREWFRGLELGIEPPPPPPSPPPPPPPPPPSARGGRRAGTGRDRGLGVGRGVGHGVGRGVGRAAPSPPAAAAAHLFGTGETSRIVRESPSSSGIGVVIARRSSGSLRMAVDFTSMEQITEGGEQARERLAGALAERGLLASVGRVARTERPATAEDWEWRG